MLTGSPDLACGIAATKTFVQRRIGPSDLFHLDRKGERPDRLACAGLFIGRVAERAFFHDDRDWRRELKKLLAVFAYGLFVGRLAGLESRDRCLFKLVARQVLFVIGLPRRV